MPDEPVPKPEPEPDSYEAKIAEMQASAEALKAPELPDEVEDQFDQRMKELEARASKVKAARDNQKAQEVRRERQDRDAARGLGFGLSIAYTIIGLPIFGFGIGWLIDRSTKTDHWKGLFMLAGAVIGIAMAFVMMNRQNKD